ncbi:hypothetical protein OQZ33_07085 [Pedobacter sp. MC2016-05]|uniref:hypothetical protein n=1 Tax=Pedobacter sp. MC2016-05 TaxID=2994474 RepID=UPI0022483C89|nr:hypothetical protein [Pedobacter sp. MC2016-05]MCX2474089.1 hypothetical protein [Pedobacter sp. MC2016-05]
MADNNQERILFDIEVQSNNSQVTQTIESIDQLNDKLLYWKDLQKAAANPKDLAEANQKIKEIKGSIDQMNKSGNAAPFKSFKTQMREAREEALRLSMAGDTTSAAYQAAAQRIADLRDQMDVLNRTTASYDSGNKFMGASKAIGLIASSAQGLQGTMVTLGLSSDTAADSINKLMALQSIIELSDTWADSVEFLRPMLTRLGILKAVQAEVTVATEASTAATITQSTVTTAATTATNTFSKALIAIPLLAIVALITYLVANFDDIKKSVKSLLPEMSGASDTFDKFKNILVGVGNVIVQYFLIPIKAAVALIKGDFKGAINEMKNGLNVVKNFKDGQAKGEANDRAAARKKELEDDIKLYDNKIEILKASGKKTEKFERDQLIRKLALAADDTEATKKVLQERAVFEASTAKKNADEADKIAKEKAAKTKQAAEKAKAERDKLKQQEDAEIKKTEEAITAANKVIEDASRTAREKEVNEVYLKYSTLIDGAMKHGQDVIALQSAQNTEILALNKKHDEEQAKAKKEAADKALIEENNRYKALAEAKVLEVENANVINDGDSPDTVRGKLQAVADVKFLVSEAIFQRELEQLKGQDEQIRLLKAKHEKELTDNEKANAEARANIAKGEKESKLLMAQAVGDGLSAVGEIVGEQTVAAKGLAIASSAINTYSAIAGQLAAFSKVPIPGYAIAQAIATGVFGLANIKKIASTNVPTKGGSGGARVAIPPTINSTVLRQSENGTTAMVGAITDSKSGPVRTYLVNKDLQTQAQKDALKEKYSNV